MFGFFKKRPSPEKPETLFFKSNTGAFAYACKYMNNEFKRGNTVTAMVEKQTETDDGRQMVMLRVAGEGGGKTLGPFSTLNSEIPRLSVGDLAALHVSADVPPSIPMAAVAVCFVVAKLEPVLHLRDGWKVARAG